MTYEPIELSAIDDFESEDVLSRQEWARSEAGFLVERAPTTKGRFARLLVQRLSEAAGVTVSPLPGRRGNRVQIGRSVCEIKFSMESPARFQQVRPPADEYDFLIGIAVRPDCVRYWLIPAPDVAQFIADDRITFQHAESSRWFFAAVSGSDPFSSYRMRAPVFRKRLRGMA